MSLLEDLVKGLKTISEEKELSVGTIKMSESTYSSLKQDPKFFAWLVEVDPDNYKRVIQPKFLGKKIVLEEIEGFKLICFGQKEEMVWPQKQ